MRGPQASGLIYALLAGKSPQEAVRDLIQEDVHEKKLHKAMADCFQRLQDEAIISNYLAAGSAPTKTQAEARAPTRPRTR